MDNASKKVALLTGIGFAVGMPDLIEKAIDNTIKEIFPIPQTGSKEALEKAHAKRLRKQARNLANKSLSRVERKVSKEISTQELPITEQDEKAYEERKA